MHIVVHETIVNEVSECSYVFHKISDRVNVHTILYKLESETGNILIACECS